MSHKFVPLRNYIFDRLYHNTQGYFCKQNFQLGQLASPINFKQLIGYDDYQRQLYQKYPPNAWLTPCQIFKPYYGMTVAKYISIAHKLYNQNNQKTDKIRIVEAGAGTGSAAQSILYYFNNYQRQLFNQLQYTIVQISPVLCKRIEQKLSKSYPNLLKNNQIKIRNQNINNYSTPNRCFTLFFQVLDNLPHDKLIWSQQLNKYNKYVTVNISTNQQSSQYVQKDQIVKQCLRYYNQLDPQQQPALNILDKVAQYFVKKIQKKTVLQSKDLFLPTSLLHLLKRIKKNMPQSHLVISDFDKLISNVPGINSPIVSTKGYKSQQKKDYNTYLVERGSSDIFFPVNFNLLTKMYEKVCNKNAKVVKSYDFINQFCEQSWGLTKSNFNPIKQDFANTSFFVTEIAKNSK